MRIDDEENDEISGIPQNADPSKMKIAVDYSKLNNLKLINDLSLVKIKNINSSICSTTGSYSIDAIYNTGDMKDTSNFKIPFDTVDSAGLCRITVGNNNSIRIDFENEEGFSYYPIAFEKTIIKDNDGKLLFKLENYTNQQQFICCISYNSIIQRIENLQKGNGGTDGNNNQTSNNTNLRSNIVFVK